MFCICNLLRKLIFSIDLLYLLYTIKLQMKVFATFLFFFLYGGILVFSCKNGSSGNDSAKNLLVGKWKIVKITTEENYTAAIGAVDDNNIIVAFNVDGTGYSSSVSGGSAFKWELANNDTYLNITDSASANVISLLLTKTSKGSFTVKDTSTHPAQWEVFKKQNEK